VFGIVKMADLTGASVFGYAAKSNSIPQEGDLGMKVRPLADRILVKREEPSETVRGGIIIPDSAKEKPQEGKVVEVGPGRLDEDGKRVPLEVKKGDRILMGKYSGTEVKIDGDEHIIMREDDVLAVIE
jgi:chaperonin GroES